VEILIIKYRWQYQFPCSYCSGSEIFWQDDTLAHRVHENCTTVNPVNTRLHRSNSLTSQQSWPQPSKLYRIWGKLLESVYRSRIHDVAQLKSLLIEEWEHFHQVTNDTLCFWASSLNCYNFCRRYWNLLICLQLVVTLSLQNLVKIQCCLPELWKCIHVVYFFPDTL